MSLPTLYEYYTNGGIIAGLSANQPYFTLNNRNISIYSGSMHYFRVPKYYWRDRLRKMRAAGLNTIETYVPWNLHEPEPNKYDFGHGGSDFENFLDIELFLKTAKEEDLFAIVRPGPYICAEWEFGGLPSWLLRKRDIIMRSSDKYFFKRVQLFFSILLNILFSYQFTKGGPIIGFQIENEFGSLRRHDMKYLGQLKNIFKQRHIHELLFTSDGPSIGTSGQMPGTLFAGNFQNEPTLELNILQRYQPDRPLLVMEYWTGWFDHWGEGHSKFHKNDFAYTLGVILKYPASVNLYMFHGGTNFGFMNGANLKNRFSGNEGFQPDTTSYDYDAPLSESGDYTDKYFITRRLLARFNKIKTYVPRIPPLNRKVVYKTIGVIGQLNLDNIILQIPYRIISPNLISMEFLPINNNAGQSYGYILYRRNNIYIPRNSLLTIKGRVCDTVMVLIDGSLKSKILESSSDFNGFGYWKKKNPAILIETEYFNATLDLLVENLGRVNFGTLKQYTQYKGLWQGPVLLNNDTVNDWTIIPLEFKTNWTRNLTNWQSPNTYHIGPTLYRTQLILHEKPGDTFLDMQNWVKGIIIVNGFVLSRYLKLGPQLASYLPAPFLKKGTNEILIFEHFQSPDFVKFTNTQLFENIKRPEMMSKSISIYITK